MVVDTPVFDEIKDRIQIIQFFKIKNQSGGIVLIAELGELEPHPLEIDIEGIGDVIKSYTQQLSKKEIEEKLFNVEDIGSTPEWLVDIDTQLFSNKKDPSNFPRIYTGKYIYGMAGKTSIHIDKDRCNIEFDSIDGEIVDEKLSLVYHYGNEDWISIFKFIPFF